MRGRRMRRSPSDRVARWRSRSSCSCLLVVAGSPAWAAAASDSSPSLAGHWKGTIAAPGRELAFDLDLRATPGGALSGDISIPAQNAFDLALGDVTATASRLQFKIVGIPGDPSFDGTVAADGAHVEGSFKQGGADLSFEMERVEGAAATAKAALEGFDDFTTKRGRGVERPRRRHRDRLGRRGGLRQGLRLARPRSEEADDRRHPVRDRLDHQGDDRDHAGHAGRRRQGRVGPAAARRIYRRSS